MKVVLLKDVRDMGRAGSAVDVSDGHALNFLIPRKMAVLATPASLKRAESLAKAAIERREIDSKLVSDRLSALAEEKVVIRKKANDQGHLYDGVDAKEIAEAAGLPEDAIHIERPFKELGEFEVPVARGEDFGKITILIETE
ncbi:MAG TPA: 50S ribosomal protein L9 [Candidatus Paceibacterota bacterium]